MIDSEVTLLPEPDSPTIATVSPGMTSKEMLLHDRAPFAIDEERCRQVRDGEDRLYVWVRLLRGYSRHGLTFMIWRIVSGITRFRS